MSQTFADFEFHAQEGNATRRTNAPEEGHATNRDGQRLEVLAEIVRQCPWRQMFSNLGRGLEVEAVDRLIDQHSSGHVFRSESSFAGEAAAEFRSVNAQIEFLLRDALRQMGRSDLIGNGKQHLVPTYQPIGTGSAHEGKRRPGGAPPARTTPFKTQHTGLPRTPPAPRQAAKPKRPGKR